MFILITAFVMSATCALVALERINAKAKRPHKTSDNDEIVGFAAL